jgi:hypothetical protein
VQPVQRGAPIVEPPELVGPDYNLYCYRHDLYKIVHFKTTAPRGLAPVRSKEDGFKHDDKLPQAISRARRVCLELALCNDWKWFATFTIAENNYDRKNLDGYYTKFKEWLKYLRKKYDRVFPYLLVPEQHGDGSWHMHGFFNSDMDILLTPFEEEYKAGADIPWKLVEKGYYNCKRYQKRFGFCSFGKIRNHDATAFYVTKYISKSFMGDARRVGLDLYYCSQGLNRASYFDSVYGPCSELDACLVNRYEWCDTGFFGFDRQPGDDPLLDILEKQSASLYPLPQEAYQDADYPDVVEYYEVTQDVISGFYS